jgi:hypothetical protein
MREGWVRGQILTIRATLYRFETPPSFCLLLPTCVYSTQTRDTDYSGGGFQEVPLQVVSNERLSCVTKADL